MKKNFMRLFLFVALATVFSFAPKSTSSVSTIEEKYQSLTVDYSSIYLNSDGWSLEVYVNPESSTKLVTITFVCDIHEPNGTVLYNVNLRYFNVAEEGQDQSHLGWWIYYETIPVANSGYPAGSYSANVHNVGASVYTPF